MPRTLPKPTIAPAEALLATIGIKPVVSREVEKVHLYQLREAMALDKTVAKKATALVNGELEDEYADTIDYKAVLADLAKGFQAKQAQQMIAAFPGKYRSLGAGFIMLATSLATELQKMYPISQYATVMGTTNERPSDLKFWQFVNILEVLNDPLMVFPLMASGALLRKQGQAVRLVYPTLSSAIDNCLFQASVAAKTAKKSHELEPRAEIGVKAWFGQSPIPTPVLQLMQSNHMNAQAAQDNAPQPPPPGQSSNASYLSPSEKADNNPR